MEGQHSANFPAHSRLEERGVPASPDVSGQMPDAGVTCPRQQGRDGIEGDGDRRNAPGSASRRPAAARRPPRCARASGSRQTCRTTRLQARRSEVPNPGPARGETTAADTFRVCPVQTSSVLLGPRIELSRDPVRRFGSSHDSVPVPTLLCPGPKAGSRKHSKAVIA
jgi:hypothetical protein